MRLKVTQHLGELSADIQAIVPQAKKDMRSVVSEGIKTGNVVARDFARQHSAPHAKDYPKKFSSEMYGGLSDVSGGALIAGEYGPTAEGQGLLPLERGNRNTKPHLDLARSADLIAPSFADEVGKRVDGWFW